MQLSEISQGDTVDLDGGFTCTSEGPAEVFEDDTGLYFHCGDGKHYLDGQVGEDGHLIGVSAHEC